MEEALFEEASSGMTLSLFSMGSMKAGQNAVQEGTVANSCGSLGNRSQSLQECLLQLDEQVGSSMTQEAENVPNFHDSLFYIFTSGTTGLPKATITKHSRLGQSSQNVCKHCILTASLLNPQFQIHIHIRCIPEHEPSEI